jgi:hypothetical protein
MMGKERGADKKRSGHDRDEENENENENSLKQETKESPRVV